ncbi:MAG: ATP-binding protein, partial [Polyangiales bacterium]
MSDHNTEDERPGGAEEAIPERRSGAVPVGSRNRRSSGLSDLGGEGTESGDYPRDQVQRHIDAALRTPPPGRVLDTVLRLSRQVGVEMRDEDIVHAYVEALRSLFPERLFAIRLLSFDDGNLSLAYATGRLDESRRDVLEISREALERHEIDEELMHEHRVQINDEYVPLFHGASRGFDVPMMDGSRLVGVLAVEYPDGHSEPADDRAVVGQIAVQLAASLRNARLMRESTYLRDYLGKLLDHANAPIIVIGRRRDIRVVNQAFLALTQRTREEMLGQDFVHLLPESERTRLLPVFVNALRGRPTSNFEINLPRLDGGSARIAANVASILSSDGEVEGVIAIGRDLTEVRELEEQVIQAEKLATLGQLAAGVVHELNNPLTSISVYGEYLLKTSERSDTEEGDVEKLRRIVESAERILRFTRDLVTYARPSTEEPQFLSIHDELEQAIVFCEHVLDEVGASVDKSYAEELPPIYGIKGQLHQVFINLITNACHAMPEGAGRLRIETTPVGDDQLRVRIQDNGRGVPPDDLARIFEPFFTTKGEGTGTGLGLSI